MDALVLKPMKLGGLAPCMRLARHAAEAGVRVWLTTTIDGGIMVPSEPPAQMVPAIRPRS